MKSITGIILAGGLSSRMGQDKGLIQYKGRTLLEYCINALKPMCSEIIISSNNLEYEQFGFRVIADVYQKVGPIGGLYSALAEAGNEDVIVCPCDMPFITTELFDKLLNEKGENKAAIAVSAINKIYPTLGYYHKSCLPVILQFIEQGQYKLQLLIKELKAQTILIEDDKSLLNFNSPEDLI
ncbi:molybdenum cofactor guanylyltransferase [Carboxylicivirga mesophila]|uniref:Probable molybdenum cofactor guanylyltransferase n=1 Tax=Carboxylicivirga mesophila TaxID=1166478 RepID=A0ABS5K915_9BACT|nr:molybdenum cofactor guanylyltransferase [Carboxylicivirga mesophila]MBS2210888.1 molybdenum cofactor guanylyltransferase [Carboxylicivirga mesophila]